MMFQVGISAAPLVPIVIVAAVLVAAIVAALRRRDS